VGAICGLFATLGLWRGRSVQGWAWGAPAVILLTLAVVRPAWLQGPRRLWERLGRLLGVVNSRVVLTGLFFIVVTPVGVIKRLFGWDPLLGRPSHRSVGWVPYSNRQHDPRHYERMY